MSRISPEKFTPEEQRGPEKPELRAVVNRESVAIEKFFGQKLDVPQFPAEITPERYKEWKEKAFELHYLPPIDMFHEGTLVQSQFRQYPGWLEKPGNITTKVSFFDAIKKGHLPPDSAELPGAWILVDERPKPNLRSGYEGTLVAGDYENDILAPVLRHLREQGIITPKSGSGSRSFISQYELSRLETKEAIAQTLAVTAEQIRLPRAIEWNYLGNAFYYKEWGNTNAREWFQDVYDKEYGLQGGAYAYSSGLSDVKVADRHRARNDTGFRPLVIFPSEKQGK